MAAEWEKYNGADFFRNFEIFNNENLGSVRTLTDEEGNIWFFANDVADCLGYEKTRDAISTHTDLEDRKALKYKACPESWRAKFFKSNDFMDKIFINEAGLYQMIFESHMPKAKEFKSWITHEVLPSIREHGGYVFGQEKLNVKEKEALAEEIKEQADKIKTILKRRHELIAETKDLKEQKKELKDKVKTLKDKFNREAEENIDYFNKMIVYETIQAKLEERIDRMEHPEKYEAIDATKAAEEKAYHEVIYTDQYGNVFRRNPNEGREIETGSIIKDDYDDYEG